MTPKITDSTSGNSTTSNIRFGKYTPRNKPNNTAELTIHPVDGAGAEVEKVTIRAGTSRHVRRNDQSAFTELEKDIQNAKADNLSVTLHSPTPEKPETTLADLLADLESSEKSRPVNDESTNETAKAEPLTNDIRSDTINLDTPESANKPSDNPEETLNLSSLESSDQKRFQRVSHRVAPRSMQAQIGKKSEQDTLKSSAEATSPKPDSEYPATAGKPKKVRTKLTFRRTIDLSNLSGSVAKAIEDLVTPRSGRSAQDNVTPTAAKIPKPEAVQGTRKSTILRRDKTKRSTVDTDPQVSPVVDPARKGSPASESLSLAAEKFLISLQPSAKETDKQFVELVQGAEIEFGKEWAHKLADTFASVGTPSQVDQVTYVYLNDQSKGSDHPKALLLSALKTRIGDLELKNSAKTFLDAVSNDITTEAKALLIRQVVAWARFYFEKNWVKKAVDAFASIGDPADLAIMCKLRTDLAQGTIKLKKSDDVDTLLLALETRLSELAQN